MAVHAERQICCPKKWVFSVKLIDKKQGKRQGGEKKETPLRRAAVYVRTQETQQSFIDVQTDLLWQYAAFHNIKIVNIYADKDAVVVKQPALQKLIGNVKAGVAKFTAILLLDKHRWKFGSDTDRSGYYESICHRAGIEVRYVAVPIGVESLRASSFLKILYRAIG